MTEHYPLSPPQTPAMGACFIQRSRRGSEGSIYEPIVHRAVVRRREIHHAYLTSYIQRQQNTQMQLFLEEYKSPLNNLLQNKRTAKRQKADTGLFSIEWIVMLRMRQDCKSVSSDAPVLSRGLETLQYLLPFSAPRSRLKNNLCHSQMGIWSQSDCNARRNYRNRTAYRGRVAVTAKWPLLHRWIMSACIPTVFYSLTIAVNLVSRWVLHVEIFHCVVLKTMQGK